MKDYRKEWLEVLYFIVFLSCVFLLKGLGGDPHGEGHVGGRDVPLGLLFMYEPRNREE